MTENKDLSAAVEAPPLVCRPSKSLWALVVVAVLCGLALIGVVAIQISQESVPSRHPTNIWEMGGFVFVFFGLPALGLAWSLIRCRLVADERGLTFTRFFTTQFVLWEKVEDYELRAQRGQTDSKHPSGYIRVGGKWLCLGFNNVYADHYDALLQMVESQAKWSRAHGWQLRELRTQDDERPESFEYVDVPGWRIWGLGVGAVFLLALLFSRSMFSSATGSGEGPTLTKFYFSLALWGLLVSPHCLIHYSRVLARRPYLGQKIVVTAEGLSLCKDSVQTTLTWEAIESYYLQVIPGFVKPGLAVVEGLGQRIEFVQGIKGTESLMRIIQGRATEASSVEWAYLNGADAEVVGGAASMWENAKIGVGPKLHHYRTRTVRALLLGGVVFMIALVGLVLILKSGFLGEASTAGVPPVVLLIVPSGIVTLIGYLEYRFTVVRCDSEGLGASGWRGKSFIAWNEIEKIRKGEWGYVAKGRGGSVRFWNHMADIEGLKAEIEKRTGLKWNAK